MGICRKVEFAKRRGLSKGRVSQLIKLGMPVLPSGELDYQQAAAWCDANIARQMLKTGPARNGSSSGCAGSPRGGPPSGADRAGVAACRRVLDQLRNAAGQLPELAAGLGAPMEYVDATTDVFDFLLSGAVGGALVERVYGNWWGFDEPIADPDLAAIAAQRGIAFNRKAWQQDGDRILEDRVVPFFAAVADPGVPAALTERLVIERLRARGADLLARLGVALELPAAVVHSLAAVLDAFVWAALGPEALGRIYGGAVPPPAVVPDRAEAAARELAARAWEFFGVPVCEVEEKRVS